MAVPSPPLRIIHEFSPPIVDPVIRRQVIAAMDTALLELADFLQQNSPRGVSPVRESLKGSWNVIPARKVRNFPWYKGEVVNTSSNAINRLAGRGPGKFPPFGKGTPLAKWADAKDIPPFLVARKIAREGTERWKESSGRPGYFGLDPSTKLGADAQLLFQVSLENALADQGLFL